MKSFPMIRVKWSNEHIMAAVFLVLMLYHLPIWSNDPGERINSILLVCLGLLIDGAAVILRHKRLWCCVSGAVTAAMVSLLTMGVPIWGRILGVAIALILGKHVWGGTGQNLLNPAMVGIMGVMVFFNIPFPFFDYSPLLLPAVILSLVFLMIRPFAGAGYMLGMLVSLFLIHSFSLEDILAYGVLFWGCLVMTDPVTITPHPVAGLASGFLAGFAALYYFPMPVITIGGILAVNLFSDVVSSILPKNRPAAARIRTPKIYSRRSGIQMVNLIKDEQEDAKPVNPEKLKKEDILSRIRNNGVVGMGGAAFPAYKKIMAVSESHAEDKYLIINGAECDPGLIHDKWIMQHHMSELVMGAKLLNTCVPFRAVYLAVKNTDGLKAEEPIQLKKLPDLYPVGAEKILIHKALGKRISHERLPAEEGILVLNVQTVYAISEAVLKNKEIHARFLTVADIREKTARVVKARLGTRLTEIMEAIYPGASAIYAGGGIMQAHLAEPEDILDSTVNFICTGPFPKYKESPQCSKCGRCSKSCPSGLRVNVIADLVDQNKPEEALKYCVDECISCGSCSYSCLAGRNLSAKVQRAKEAI